MQAVLLLGSNMGEREGFLAQAREAIGQCCGVILQASQIHETPAWGFAQPVPDFLNQALRIDTTLSPEDLLQACLDIERLLGRLREEKATPTEAAPRAYASRPIDIDILFYEDLVCQSPRLTLPHPRLPQRSFALRPLAEVAPNWVHPQLGRTAAAMLAICED